jgi:hypothetical protein
MLLESRLCDSERRQEEAMKEIDDKNRRILELESSLGDHTSRLDDEVASNAKLKEQLDELLRLRGKRSSLDGLPAERRSSKPSAERGSSKSSAGASRCSQEDLFSTQRH